MGSYKYCICFTRKFRWNEAQPPPDVKSAFAAFSYGGAHMDADQLRQFLADSQGDGVAAEEAERIVDEIRKLRYRNHVGKAPRSGIAVEDFHHYLFDEELNPPLRSQVHQDMSAPLSHYYIYTGHNSYLTGNQLTSDCSDVPIVKALQNGVRVIELDIWPNSTKDNIDVLHGRTLTSPVELLKCLTSIKEYAFSASEYPLVITLEDHLTPDLQAKVAQMALDTFGEILYYPDSEEHHKEFPSPDALKKRIILSTKPPKEYLEAKISKDMDNGSQNGKVPNEEEAWGTEVPDLKTEIESDEKGYGRSLWLMYGFFRANGGCGYIKKPDFLLKMGPNGEVFDPRATLPVNKTLKVKVYMGDGWRMDFKQTHFDAYSPPDFYTRVGIAGVPVDSIMKKTKTTEDDWTPVWNEEFTFSLSVPELALLRIEVHEYDINEKDDFGGQTCLPVSELRPGIRCVPLFDRKGNKFKSVKLLMRFEFV